MTQQLTDDQLETLYAVADILVPPTDAMPSLRDADPERIWLARAISAHPVLARETGQILDDLALQQDLAEALRALHDDRLDLFLSVSTFVLGTYVMVPEVRSRYGYPGQVQRPAPTDLAVEELSDEIFATAMEYGGTYRDVANSPAAGH